MRQFKDRVKMKKIIRILSLLLIAQNTFGQLENVEKIPMFSDSITKDSYIENVDLKRKYIDSLINHHKEQIRIDTISFKINYTIRKEDSSYISQRTIYADSIFNLKFVDETRLRIEEFIKSTDSLNSKLTQVIVTTSKSRILKIQFLSPYFPSTDYPIYSIFGNYHNLYFDDNRLIFSGYSCIDPHFRIGSCGGTYSHYFNYFKSGIYFNTLIEGSEYDCGCGFNMIVNSRVIDELTQTILNEIK